MSSKFNAIIIDEKDNVATTLSPIAKGEKVKIRVGCEIVKIEAKDDIPFGHKIAIRDIPLGGDIIKYGWPIGVATRDISVGGHVHVHNVLSKRGCPRSLKTTSFHELTSKASGFFSLF